MSCLKIDGKKCKKVIDSLLGEDLVEEVETDGCSGYKSHTDGCPLNGVFDKASPICKKCYEDARDAMTENMRDCEQL